MRLKEQRLWDRTRANLSRSGLLMERVENVVSEGTPDIHTLHNGLCTWIELKAVISVPKRAETPLLGDKAGLRVAQQNWHATWHRHGGRSVVLIGVGSYYNLAVPGALAYGINQANLNALRAAAVAEGWAEIIAYLKGTI